MISRSAFLLVALAIVSAVPSLGAQAAAPAMDEMMSPGVSAALARHRAATLRDVRYRLELD
ncbi:MAG: hypothetical protein KY444_01130, partial [Gemmatimonadetes bacterium]|nr:hypothetical protein [Gemmatimonadota bacterium]